MWLFLLACLALPPTLAQVPPDDAVVQQDLLPAYRARTDRATIRVSAAESWFAGTVVFEAAWPGYAGVDLLDADVLRVARSRLATAAKARAAERVASLPVDGALAAQVTAERTKALDAEDRFAALEDRLLAGIDAGLSRAPELGASTAQARESQWSQAIAAATDEADPATAAAGRDALSARQQLQQARRAAVRKMTVAGDTGLAELAKSLGDAPLTPDSAATLVAIEPLLSGPAAAEAKTALEGAAALIAAAENATRQAQVDAVRQRIDTPPGPGPEETLETLGADVEQAKQALQAAPEELRPLRQAELELAEKRLALTSGLAAEDAAAVQRRADAAREELDLTLAAGEVEDKKLTALRERVLKVQSAVADVYDAEVTRRAGLDADLERVRIELGGRIEAGANAQALPILDPQRQPSIDTAFLALRATVSDLYDILDAVRVDRRDHGIDQTAKLALLDGWGGGRGSPELAKLDDRFQTAAASLREALDNRERTLKITNDEAYRLLDTARQSRRELRRDASAAARSQARRDFIPELGREVGALPGQLAAAGRDLFGSLLSIPSFLSDLNSLWALIFGSFELVILVGIWGFGRRQMPVLVERALAVVEQRTASPLEGNSARSKAQLSALGIAVLDLFAGLFIFNRLGHVGGIGLLSLLWSARSAVVAAPLLVRSLLASPDDIHPSLRLVASGTEALAARTVRWFAVWVALTKVGTYVMVNLLDADRLRDIVASVSSLAFWGLLVACTVMWGPVAVATLARQAEKSPLTAWAAHEVGPSLVARVFNLPRFAVALVVVSGQLTVHVFGQLIEGRAGLGWLQSALARRQLKAEDETPEEVVPLDDELLARLDALTAESMPRPEVDARLKAAYDEWKRTGRRGLVSVIGDPGSGKGRLSSRLAVILDTEVTQLKVPHRIDSPQALARWLSVSLGLPETDSPDAITEALLAQPARVISVDRCQLLFLRAVGGYAPLQALITTMTGSAEQHFWMLGIHEPAWDYLMGIAARLKLDAFRDHVRLSAASGPELAEWLETGTEACGRKISYDKLATTGLLGGDEGLAERRARGAFWRLMADASGGNPSNAAALWRQALQPRDAEVLDVRMFAAPEPDDIQSLSDDLLFSLTALIQHERATAEELGRVLNKRPAAARSTVKHLVHLDLASYDPTDATYHLSSLWAPAVQRLLQQKHFLYTE